ncbi:MAG: carboxymuconolactone decarboxylase family protein [Pseudomonadota bacterium]
MPDFKIHALDGAEGDTRAVLEKANTRYGFVPNLIGALAEAPAVADAYMQIGNALGETTLAPEELHVVWFAINAYHGCDYCMAAHTGIAKMQKIDDAVIETARSGETYADARLQTLKDFALKMVEQRGWVAPEEIDAFLAAGFTKANVIEIILAIAHKTLSNYTNHVVETPVDDRFGPFAWTAPAVAAE